MGAILLVRESIRSNNCILICFFVSNSFCPIAGHHGANGMPEPYTSTACSCPYFIQTENSSGCRCIVSHKASGEFDFFAGWIPGCKNLKQIRPRHLLHHKTQHINALEAKMEQTLFPKIEASVRMNGGVCVVLEFSCYKRPCQIFPSETPDDPVFPKWHCCRFI